VIKKLVPTSKKQQTELSPNNDTILTEEHPKMSLTSKKDKKISLYAQALSAAEKLDFETAGNVDGIDDEIKLMRIKIKAILIKEPQNIKLLMQAAKIVANMVEEKYNMDKGQNKGLINAVKNLVKDVGLQVGVAMINKKLGND
jgi:hypothetical protein